MSNEIFTDKFWARMSRNDDPTDRTEAFNTGNIVAIASSTNATPIEVTCAANHNLATGDKVVISGHTTNTSANGSWTVTYVNATKITLDGSVGVGVGGATGRVIENLPIYIPVLVDGLGNAGEDVAPIRIDTEHGAEGNKYSAAGPRNLAEKSIRVPFFPEQAGTFMDAVFTKTSGTAFPAYHTIQQFWVDDLAGSSPDVGRELRGCVFNGIDFSFQRGGQNLAALEYTGSFFLNQNVGITERSVNITGVTNADPAVVTAAGHGFLDGDEVVIASVGGATGANGTWTVSECTNDTFQIDVAGAPGVYTTGGTATVSRPEPSSYFPTQEFLTTVSAYIDFQMADDADDFPAAWTGDNPDLTQLTLGFKRNIKPTVLRPSSTATLHLTWSKLERTIPTLTFSGTLTMQHTDYVRITRTKKLRRGRMRVMMVSNTPNAETTSTTNLAVGGTSVVVASATGLHVGDVILLEQVTAETQQVLLITGISGTTLTVEGWDGTGATVAMNGGSETINVRNGAGQFYVPLVDLVATPPQGTSGVKTITLNGEGRVLTGQTELVIPMFYNDDGA